MSSIRFVSGIVLLIAAVLWLGISAYFLSLYPANVVYYGWFASYLLALIAGFILLVSLRKKGSIHWHFEATTGILLLISSILILLADAYFLTSDLHTLQILEISGDLAFIAFAILILLSTTKRLGALNLPRIEGVTFSILFLLSSLMGTLTYTIILNDYVSWISRDRSFEKFIPPTISMLASQILLMVAMIILLYSCIRQARQE